MDLPEKISLLVGEAWSARLPGLGSAGYQWEWEAQGSLGAVDVSLTFLAVESPESGGLPPDNSNAEQQMRVLAVQPGVVRLRLAQRRAWENDQPALHEHTIEIVVG